MPQRLEKLRFALGPDPLAAPGVQAAIAAQTARLGASGRLVIRPSGTEPLIRVMVESKDAALMSAVVDELVEAVTQAGGAPG